jgi:hypothetical protein
MPKKAYSEGEICSFVLKLWSILEVHQSLFRTKNTIIFYYGIVAESPLKSLTPHFYRPKYSLFTSGTPSLKAL